MRKFWKRGMTLGEICIVFAIMGIVATMTLVTAKPYEKSIKYSYEKVYTTLNTAFYNAQLTFASEYKTEIGTDANLSLTDNFPDNTYTLCRMLISYINTSQSSDKANCSATPIVIQGKDANGVDVETNVKSPSFIASNGVKYWVTSFNSNEASPLTANTSPLTANFTVSKIEKTETTSTYTDSDTPYTQKFFVVVADINGSSGPNTTIWRDKKPADIVAFAVMQSGDVVPLGYPRADARYITANAMNSNDRPIAGMGKVTLYKAIRAAWAYGEATNTDEKIFKSADNALSLDFNDGCKDAASNACISTGSPFRNKNGLDFNKNDEGKTTYRKVNGEEHKDCQISEADPTLDPTACYVKITQYH